MKQPAPRGNGDTYPGVEYSIQVMVVDVANQPVYAQLYTDLLNTDKEVKFANDFQRSLLLQGVCSQVNYSLLTTEVNITVTVNLRTTSYNGNTSLMLTVNIRDCPLGFAIDKVTNKCQCSQLYHISGRTCNITSELIEKQKYEWIGVFTKNGRQLPAYCRDCPMGYCNVQEQYANLSDTNSVCTANREGLVCGRCKDGYSNVFGLQACEKCSNYYILTIFIYITAGILLVWVIHVLDLTVTHGTINGLIFYAQMTAITNNIFSSDPDKNYSTRLVRFINLEMGIPISTCF